MNTNNAGGGEILQYINGNSKKVVMPYMDKSLISQFDKMWMLKILIVALLLFIAFIIIMKILNINSPFIGKGIKNELRNMAKIQRHEKSLVKINRYIARLDKIVKKSPFSINKVQEEFLEYNLERADIRIPGNSRVYKATEFHAIKTCAIISACLLGLLITLFVNAPLGIVMIMIAIISGNTAPTMYIRNIVHKKDIEIEENFFNFYLMLHYNLVEKSNTPLVQIIKSYDRTTDSIEMHRLSEYCISCMETYGESEGADKVASRYKEINYIRKLMRLIRQSNDGGQIIAELNGFRKELLDSYEYIISKRGDKLILKAKASFYLLYPILFQAILSAMSIYIKDISAIGSIF